MPGPIIDLDAIERDVIERRKEKLRRRQAATQRLQQPTPPEIDTSGGSVSALRRIRDFFTSTVTLKPGEQEREALFGLQPAKEAMQKALFNVMDKAALVFDPASEAILSGLGGPPGTPGFIRDPIESGRETVFGQSPEDAALTRQGLRGILADHSTAPGFAGPARERVAQRPFLQQLAGGIVDPTILIPGAAFAKPIKAALGPALLTRLP